MANTTNLNLSKLDGSEKLKTFPSVNNDNLDAIDRAFGADFGVSGKPSVNAAINSLGDGVAILANGNTHAAITSGQWVYVRGHGSLSEGLYRATSNISANGTLSGSNLTADTSGGLNTVYSELNSKMMSSDNAYASVSDLKSALLTVAQGMSAYESRLFEARVTSSNDPNISSTARYAGYIVVNYNASSVLMFTWNAVSPWGTDLIIGYDNGTWTIKSLNSNIYKTITNGNVVGGHSYLLTLKETSLADAYFEMLYSADVNNGVKVFSTIIMLSNKLYACTGKITLSNGTISITDAYRQALDASSANALSVSIQAIRQIA